MDESELLPNVTVEVEKELAYDDGVETLTSGEIKISLELTDGTEYDIDDDGAGSVSIHYWKVK